MYPQNFIQSDPIIMHALRKPVTSGTAFPRCVCYANLMSPVYVAQRIHPLPCISGIHTAFLRLWSSPQTISDSQLHMLPCFHLCPIYLVLSKGLYFFRMGYLISGPVSRLDAFSVYPIRTWLPGRAIGMTTGTPAVRPARSSRTKARPPQISSARAG